MYHLRVSSQCPTLSPQPHQCRLPTPRWLLRTWPMSTSLSTSPSWQRTWILRVLDWNTSEGAPDTRTRPLPVSTNSRLSRPHPPHLALWGQWWGPSLPQVIYAPIIISYLLWLCTPWLWFLSSIKESWIMSIKKVFKIYFTLWRSKTSTKWKLEFQNCYIFSACRVGEQIW